MRTVIFAERVLNRIGAIQSERFTFEETVQFQVKLIRMIHDRLAVMAPLEGFREYEKGPWANIRRIIVLGFKVYYVHDTEKDIIRVRALKAPGMK